MPLNNCCRTCLRSDLEMRHISAIMTISGDDVALSDILENFYEYKITAADQLPQCICINCIVQLTMTYSFKVLIETSAKKLSENLAQIDVTVTNPNILNDDENSDDMKPKFNNAIPNTSSVANGKEEVLLFCAVCKEEFHSKETLLSHCLNKHPCKLSIGRECEFCNEKFPDFKSLIIHRKHHMSPYTCEICWEGFFSLNDLNCHFCKKSDQDQNKEQEKILRQCDQCGKSYPPGYIRMHMLIHSKERQYKCPYCPKQFKVPCGLNSHVLWTHKRTKNHQCDICNALFVSASAKSAHVRKHHLKEKKHVCESCDKSFFSKSELQRHSLTHTGVKNFHCHRCEKSYQTRYGLNTHLKSHSRTDL